VDFGDNKLTSVENIFEGSKDNMYNTYLYQNNIGSVNKNLLSGASSMAQLDVSENQLSDGSLAFVPEVIKAAENMQWINLKDNQFADGSLDALHTNMDNLDAKVSKAQIETNDSNQL